MVDYSHSSVPDLTGTAAKSSLVVAELLVSRMSDVRGWQAGYLARSNLVLWQSCCSALDKWQLIWCELRGETRLLRWWWAQIRCRASSESAGQMLKLTSEETVSMWMAKTVRYDLMGLS